MPEQTELVKDHDPVIEAYKKGIDLTLIRENLRLTVDQRIQQLMKMQEFAEELQRAGRKALATVRTSSNCIVCSRIMKSSSLLSACLALPDRTWTRSVP